jgi:hypothetical protein
VELPLLGRHLLSSRLLSDIALRLKYLANTQKNLLQLCKTQMLKQLLCRRLIVFVLTVFVTKASMKNPRTRRRLPSLTVCPRISPSATTGVCLLLTASTALSATLRLASAQVPNMAVFIGVYSARQVGSCCRIVPCLGPSQHPAAA